MKRYSKNDIPTNSAIAKQAKELVNKTAEVKQVYEKPICGLKNPCVFGNHNVNFNPLKSV